VASDIDLLVVYRGEAREDAYGKVKKTLNLLGLEPHVYSEREYKGVSDVVEKMIEHGIVLYDRRPCGRA
jgi:hypothetical protein